MCYKNIEKRFLLFLLFFKISPKILSLLNLNSAPTYLGGGTEVSVKYVRPDPSRKEMVHSCGYGGGNG